MFLLIEKGVNLKKEKNFSGWNQNKGKHKGEKLKTKK